MRKCVLIPVVFLACCIAAYGQLPEKKIENLAFMSGTWTTETHWGKMEEHWTEPLGNSMMCSYRCVKNGKVVFYEFIVIEQTDSIPVMKLRHFSPGNIAWEEKDNPYVYPLTFLEANRARFERPDRKTALTFYRTGAKTMKVMIERQEKDGRWVEDVFNYELAD